MNIEKQSEEYAKRVKAQLEKSPILGVDPTIVSNAHRMGYVIGAQDAQKRYIGTIDNLENSLFHYKFFGWILFIICMMFIIVELTILLWI